MATYDSETTVTVDVVHDTEQDIHDESEQHECEHGQEQDHQHGQEQDQAYDKHDGYQHQPQHEVDSTEKGINLDELEKAQAKPVMTSDVSLRIILHKGFQGIKQNAIPGIILQCFALLVVILYYSVDSIQSAINDLASFKDRTGLVFSAISASIFGGMIPCGIMALQRHVQAKKGIFPPSDPFRPSPWAELAYLAVVWAFLGIEVDLFYRAQAAMFGNDASFKTIASKVLFDQGPWNILFCIHQITAIYLFKDCGFSFTEFRKRYGRQFILLQVIPSLFNTWLIWFPMCAIIYSLPSSLQIPLWEIVVCFYSIAVAFTSAN